MLTAATMTPREFGAARNELLKVMAASRLNGTEMAVAVFLLDHFNIERGYAWPTRETLAAEVGVSCVSVSRAIDRLETKGFFLIQRNKGRGISNRYAPVFNAKVAEKVTRLSAKGNKVVCKRYQGCDNIPSTTPLKKPLKAQPLASPPDGGSRLPPEGNLVEPSLETPSSDSQRNCIQDSDASINDTANSQPPGRLRQIIQEVVNANRLPMKDATYWQDRDRQKHAAEMTSTDRQDYWLKELANDDMA